MLEATSAQLGNTSIDVSDMTKLDHAAGPIHNASDPTSLLELRSRMGLTAVAQRLFALGHAVVTQDGCHTQAIVQEHILAPVGLNTAMDFPVAERVDRRFIALDRKRQQFAPDREALELFDRDEAIHLLELQPKSRTHIQIRSVSFRAQATTQRSPQSFPLLLTNWKRRQSGGRIPWLRRPHRHASATSRCPSECSVLADHWCSRSTRAATDFADCKNMPRLRQRTMICKFVSPSHAVLSR